MPFRILRQPNVVWYCALGAASVFLTAYCVFINVLAPGDVVPASSAANVHLSSGCLLRPQACNSQCATGGSTPMYTAPEQHALTVHGQKSMRHRQPARAYCNDTPLWYTDADWHAAYACSASDDAVRAVFVIDRPHTGNASSDDAYWESLHAREHAFVSSMLAHNPSIHLYFVALLPRRPALRGVETFLRQGYTIRGVHVQAMSQLLDPQWKVPIGHVGWLRRATSGGSDVLPQVIIEFLRMHILHEYGGYSVATGQLFLQSLPRGVSTIIATLDPSDADLLSAPASRTGLTCTSALSSHADFFSPDCSVDTLLSNVTVNLAMARFPARSTVLATVMDRAFAMPHSSLGGSTSTTQLLTDDIMRLLREPGASIQVQLFPQYSTQPISPARWPQVLAVDGFAGAGYMLIESLRRNAVAIPMHLYNPNSSEHAAQPGSALAVALTITDVTSSIPAHRRCSMVQHVGALVIRRTTVHLRDHHAIMIRECPSIRESHAILELSVHAGTLVSEGLPPNVCNNCGARCEWGAQYARVSDIASEAALNTILQSMVYTALTPDAHAVADDVLHVTLRTHDGLLLLQHSATILVFPMLVTLMTHTRGRVDSVCMMYESLQRWFPGTSMIATNDAVAEAEPQAPSCGRYMRWLRVQHDGGLSAARNALLEAASTPFVQLLDDDFLVSMDSHLDVLLRIAVMARFDIVAPVIPADLRKFGHFRGFIRTTPEGDLTLRDGNYGRVSHCLHVDFVPNVFLAARSALQRVAWDPALKLGEHEDFFLRARAAGLQVLSCDWIHVTHNQSEWWKPNPNATAEHAKYRSDRRRVYQYFVAALRKHGLKRLDSFGLIQADTNRS